MMEEDHIAITLGSEVAIRSTRPAHIDALFAGKKPAEVVRLVPLLYAVCGRAQAEACGLALSVAAGEKPRPALSTPVIAEAVREHLMRIAVDWARALGLTPDTALLRRVHALPREAENLPRGEVAQRAARLLAELVGDRATIAAGAVSSLAQGPSLAGRLLGLVLAEGWSGLGRTEDDPAETSAFTLMRPDPAMAGLVAHYGNGLLSRLFARLVHVLRLVEGLEGSPPQAHLHFADGWATATIATSRGNLVHRARLAGGHVAGYEIVAPTDVNFATGGIAARSLAAATGDRPLRLLIEAIDPCVSYTLTTDVRP